MGHIWRFAGLDPTVTWGKGQKRPWNARLKTLCWKVGESFVKVSGREGAYYGKLYLSRKEYEQAKNEAGEYSEMAATYLGRMKTIEETDYRATLESGHLQPIAIHERCKRFAVKRFLSHFHHVQQTVLHGQVPPTPWIIAHGGHIDYEPPPGWPLEA